MAADLHIHVVTPEVTEAVLASFFSNHIGSKYFNPVAASVKKDHIYDIMSRTPQIWIGEVSWLKAAFFGVAENYVPGPVAIISDLIGEDLPVLTEELLELIVSALNQPNATSYSVAQPEKVREYLKAYIGERIFTISW